MASKGHLCTSGSLDIVRPQGLLEDVDVCSQVLCQQLGASEGHKQAAVCPGNEIPAQQLACHETAAELAASCVHGLCEQRWAPCLPVKHMSHGELHHLQRDEASRALALQGLQTQHGSVRAALDELVHALGQQDAVEEILQQCGTSVLTLHDAARHGSM